MEEQVSGSTDSPITIAVESRTTEVTESDRQGKRPKTDVSELVNEPMHLGAGTVLGRRDGFESKSCKSHGGVTNDPEHHDEGDPQHPDESQMKNRTSDESNKQQCSCLMLSSLKCSARTGSRVKPPLEFVSWLCIGFGR